VDGVRAADVVPHLKQTLLELPYVVADEWVGYRLVERARPEPPPGRVEGAPGLLPYPTVDREPTALLEAAYRQLGLAVELADAAEVAYGGPGGQEFKDAQHGMDLRHRGAPVSPPDRPHPASLSKSTGAYRDQCPRTAYSAPRRAFSQRADSISRS